VALRRAFAGQLPEPVAGRGKTGFAVPLAHWFRTDLRELTGDMLLGPDALTRSRLRPAAVEQLLADHLAERADHGHRLWTLLMLELWLRTHVAAESHDSSPVTR
jgi:asparagine synthase (glutamine-hydrolysing)